MLLCLLQFVLGISRVILEGVRTDFKLIIGKKQLELYHLKDDIGEIQNLVKVHPEQVQAIKARWMEWDQDK